MKEIESRQRRKLLLAAGALAAQAFLPLRAARALTLPPITLPPPLAGLLRRLTASIVPVPYNPYFVPQGGAIAVASPTGAPFSGGGLPGSGQQAPTLRLYDTNGAG